MLFYLYTIFIPVSIFAINTYLSKPKPNSIHEYLILFLRTTPYLFAYSFFLYFLEMEDYLSTGWAFYAVLFFLCPLTLIAFVIKYFIDPK